jgi:hypothetical protein
MDVHGSIVSLPTDIVLAFADGDYTFALRLPQQLELEKSCGFTDANGNQRRKGIIELYSDVIAGLGVVDGQVVANPYAGRASAFDCREIVRLALIGGASGTVNGANVVVSAIKALDLVKAYVDPAPIVERWTLAAAILRASVEGYDPPKKGEPVAPATPRRPRAKKPASASTKS